MTSVSLRPREDVVAHDDLPTIGRLSFWISQRTVTSRLRPGSWLDLLSGSKATLQRSQLNNAAISAFHALDHQLEPELIGLGIELHEQQVDTTLPFADATFDNVTINNGLEHLWNPQEILQECHRVLRPGGALQVVVPTWFGKPFLEFLAFRLRNRQAFIEMNDHKMYYDERTLWPMLVRAGFFPQWVSLRRIKLNCSLHAVAVKAEPSSPDEGDRR